MNIFEERKQIQPYEYPHLLGYAKAIHQSFWHVDHFVYDKDVKDFLVNLTEVEKSVIEKCMLAIGLVENKVKTFWARIDNRMPKTEISDVGHTFGGNEVIHRQTYSQLLKLLNLENKFDTIYDIPCMEGRIKYLSKYLEGVNSRSNKEFTKSLILFTLLVENAALFSQFLIISSFSKYKNILKNFSTVINATAKEENIHAKFGSELINIIKKENPEWFDLEMEEKIIRNVNKAFKAECEVLDWIFEKGQLDFISKVEVVEYLKTRFNDSLQQIGYKQIFEIDESLLKVSDFMKINLLTTKSFDFFDGKSTDYNESQSFQEDNIWD